MSLAPVRAVGLLGLSVLAATAIACGPSPSTTPGPLETASIVAPASGTPAASAVQSPATGVLVKIDASGLSDVAGFTLRMDDGREIVFRLGTLENGTEFPPGHLAEHLATSSPIRVFFRAEGADLVVYRIEDATSSASSPPASPASSPTASPASSPTASPASSPTASPASS